MKKDVFWNSLGTAAWSFSSLVLLVIVTRLNGLEASGEFSFAFALALVMYTIACYGVRTYQVSDHKRLFSTESYIVLRLVTASAAVLLTTIFVFVNQYEWGKSILIFILVGQRIFDAISDVFFGVLQKNHLLYVSGKSLFYRSVLSLAAFLTVDLLSGNLLLASLALPISSLLFLLLYDIPRSRRAEHFNITLNSSGKGRILRSIFLPFVIAALGLVFANVARYFIDIFHPALQGYFGIIVMPLSLIILLFSFVSTPALLHLSNRYNHQEFLELHRLIGKIVGLTLGATLLLLILTYFFGVPVLNALFGLDFAPYLVDVMAIVMIGCALSLSSLFTQVAIIARKLQFTALTYLLVTLLLVLLCMALIGRHEIRGAIIAYAAASMMQVLVMGTYYVRLTQRQRASKNS